VPQGMPPFGPDSSNPLSEEDRWNVIATIYSLGTPVESVDGGQAVYQANCQACHGEQGLGDGPDAVADPGDLTSLTYWSGVSNQAVFDLLSGDQIAAHAPLADAGLGDDALWSVVDYIRTFSYEYTDALALFRPLEEATVRGLVLNGATGEPPAEGTPVLLRGFTQDLASTLTMTTTLDADGNYLFDLTDVPQEWFFRVAVNYDGVDFGSDFGQFSFDVTELDLPVTVFDTTTDPANLTIQQLHLIVSFASDVIQVGELYQVNNEGANVFVGESGDPQQGTFEFSLPEGAQQPAFQRGFGGLDSFIPAQEVIATDSGFADTIPLRPGPSSLTMLVSYDLPYEDGVSLSHLVNYSTSRVNLVLPDFGVDLVNMADWQAGGQTDMGGTSVSTYGQTDLPAGSVLSLVLEGTPRAPESASASLVGGNTSELLIGAGAAVVVIALGALAVRRWQTGAADQEADQDELLQLLADLDDEFEAGEIDEQEYHRERAALKAELAAIWQSEEGE
ncbi:MAG: cytochrome c, partial [Candidatus Promineifilaceae bacterium]